MKLFSNFLIIVVLVSAINNVFAPSDSTTVKSATPSTSEQQEITIVNNLISPYPGVTATQPGNLTWLDKKKKKISQTITLRQGSNQFTIPSGANAFSINAPIKTSDGTSCFGSVDHKLNPSKQTYTINLPPGETTFFPRICHLNLIVIEN